MALNWNVTKIANYDVNFPEEKNGDWNSTTFALAFALMAVGIPRISEDNVDEVFIRVNLFENATHAMRSTGDGPIYFTYKEVFQHIGFSTNVSTMTFSQFSKQLVRMLRRDAEERTEEEREKFQPNPNDKVSAIR